MQIPRLARNDIGAVAVIAAALMACRDAPASATEDTSYRLRPGYVVDSLRPIEVDLARFRDTLGPARTALTGGAESFDALVGRFASAVQGRDSLSLRRMQISAAEYAWLVYPSSPLTRPPYQQPPEIAWMLLRQPSDVGLRRLLKRRGGEPLGITGHSCDPQPLVEGENKLWRRCTVQTATGTERLFGMVIERRGHFKFVSYQNQY